MSHYFFGPVRLGTPKITAPYEITIPLQSSQRPPGFSVTDPDGPGANAIRHTADDTPPPAFLLSLWKCKGSYQDVPAAILDGNTWHDDPRCERVAHVELVAEKSHAQRRRRARLSIPDPRAD